MGSEFCSCQHFFVKTENESNMLSKDRKEFSTIDKKNTLDKRLEEEASTNDKYYKQKMGDTIDNPTNYIDSTKKKGIFNINNNNYENEKKEEEEEKEKIVEPKKEKRRRYYSNLEQAIDIPKNKLTNNNNKIEEKVEIEEENLKSKKRNKVENEEKPEIKKDEINTGFKRRKLRYQEANKYLGKEFKEEGSTIFSFSSSSSFFSLYKLFNLFDTSFIL